MVAPRRALLVTALLLGVAGCTSPATPTAQDAATFVEEYVDLLNQGDVEALRRHLNNPAQPDDAQRRLDASGGRTWTADPAVATELTEGSWAVTITVRSDDGATETWRINVGTSDGQLVAGPLP